MRVALIRDQLTRQTRMTHLQRIAGQSTLHSSVLAATQVCDGRVTPFSLAVNCRHISIQNKSNEVKRKRREFDTAWRTSGILEIDLEDELKRLGDQTGIHFPGWEM